MKKILFVLPIVALLAAGCGKKAANAPTNQNSNQQAVVQVPAKADSPASANPSANKYKTIEVPAPATAYTSVVDNFSINFPDTPKITKSTVLSQDAGALPLTEYRELYTSGSEYAFYNVGVYHYPSTYKFASDHLSNSLQMINKVLNDLFPGTNIASQQSTTFLGNPALAGVLTVPVKLTAGNPATTDTGDYFLATINGQNIYVINTYGMDQNNYNAFVNSFKFN